MLANLAQPYLADLDITLRQIVRLIPDSAPGFGVMLRYALGWVDEHDQPYSQPSGKRIRPLLLLLCAEASGQNWSKALPAAAAVELLHNFSLIHDDIQDDSPLRHRRPTVWKIWGRPNAINAGDALFTLAYTALESLAADLPADTVLHTWRIFNRTALELTRGQHLDMQFERRSDVTVDEYISMIRGKSAALISACSEMGALIGSHDPDLAKLYADFGLNLGIAFQIRDDILGIWGDPQITGKSAATDILSRKKSLPVLHALSLSEDLVQLYAQEPFAEREVQTAIQILDDLDIQEYAQQQEARYYQQALAALEATRAAGPAAERLLALVHGLFGRKY